MGRLDSKQPWSGKILPSQDTNTAVPHLSETSHNSWWSLEDHPSTPRTWTRLAPASSLSLLSRMTTNRSFVVAIPLPRELYVCR